MPYKRKVLDSALAKYYRFRERKQRKSSLSNHKVNLYWWKGHINLGDYLSLVIYQWMCKNKNINTEKTLDCTKSLLALGSILTATAYDATVWGSGMLSIDSIPLFFVKSTDRKLDIRAVRGPITRQIVKSVGYDCPEIYGDPAILMPLIYTGKKGGKKHKVSLVSHYAKAETKNINVNRINIETHDYEHFIDELLGSEKVISSSLHGIILAEVYGIPAVYLNKNSGDDLKFWDWYMSTGRNNVRYAQTLEEAITAEPMEPIDLDRLANMQKQIMDAFPVDLWE